METNNTMEVNSKVLDLLETTKTLWSVSKESLVSISGKQTQSFGVFRNDNGLWLGTVKGLYTPMQNETLAQTIVEASAGIGKEYRGGLLQNGRKIYYQIGLPDYQVEKDTIKRYITALNSHDGSTSIGFGSSNTVVICQNTFYRAYKEVSKFRHTMTAEQRVKVAAEELKSVLIRDNKLMQDYERMANTKLTEKHKPLFSNIVNILFNSKLEDSKEVSTRKENQINKFKEVVDSELASHGETLWGLFNAVTYFENHSRTISPTKEKQMEHVMIGTGMRNMGATYDEIMAFIEANTVSSHLVNI